MVFFKPQAFQTRLPNPPFIFGYITVTLECKRSIEKIVVEYNLFQENYFFVYL